MEISDEILEKAKKKLEEKHNLALCLKAKICPFCGGQLIDKSDFHDAYEMLMCNDCLAVMS